MIWRDYYKYWKMKHWIEPDWPVARKIHAASTFRSGGTSRGCFSSLNLAAHVNDNSINVQKNRQIIAKLLDLPSDPVWLQQVHSNRVININQQIEIEAADASFTERAGVVCAVLTADCLPVLLASIDGSIICAIHAGWRGLLNGIISNAVDALNNNELIAWLGPAIGKNCFEVGKEVRDQFIAKSTHYNKAFQQKDQQHYLADIYQIARIELAGLGIDEVYGGGFCTVTDKQQFFSYRRDGETGRMATLIWRD